MSKHRLCNKLRVRCSTVRASATVRVNSHARSLTYVLLCLSLIVHLAIACFSRVCHPAICHMLLHGLLCSRRRQAPQNPPYWRTGSCLVRDHSCRPAGTVLRVVLPGHLWLVQDDFGLSHLESCTQPEHTVQALPSGQ